MVDDIQPRFPKPKILLVDLPAEATARLAAAGFNVHAGTFGRPYSVAPRDDYVRVVVEDNLPNATEQEVVFIDLAPPEVADDAPEAASLPVAGPALFASAARGICDPRPVAMHRMREDFDRVLEAGGVFIVFAGPRTKQEFVFSNVRGNYLDNRQTLTYKTWSFLSILGEEYLLITPDDGTETSVPASAPFLEAFLRGHQAGLLIDARVQPTSGLGYEGARWSYHTLMKNKYGQGVGGVIYSDKAKGRVLILPQFQDKARAVYELVTAVLPEMRPALFPDHEGGRWVHGDDYEHPSVIVRRQAQEAALKAAEAEVARLEREIESERERYAYLHALLTATDDELVAAVKVAMKVVGLELTAPPEESEAGKNKQEDLQLLDALPRLLFEVKGIGSLPGEADAQQVNKYVPRRMKQWRMTDVRGVFIVNHQRNLPPLDRNNENVFTQQQIDDAVASDTGLTTTWDLFRLVRGMLRWGWPKEKVLDVFSHRGRLPSVPSHYEAAGVVAHFFDKASVVSVEVGKPGLRVGDTVGYLLPAGFVEERVASLQVNRAERQEAKVGEKAGYKTALKRADLPDGTTVYLVRSAA